MSSPGTTKRKVRSLDQADLAKATWLTIPELCMYAKVCRRTVCQWIADRTIKRNRFPAHRLGGSWRIPRADFDEWVRSGRAKS
jgi:excisionase family DNA binding protein